jgi:hypothetical protein
MRLLQFLRQVLAVHPLLVHDEPLLSALNTVRENEFDCQFVRLLSDEQR